MKPISKYYFAGSQRVAVRTGGLLNFLLSDQLGSTNVTLDVNGVNVGELRYSAFGETRKTFGSTPTDYRYTGQREEAGIGLYYYNARWYDAYLKQFSSPDSLIPDPYNSLDYNRYAYARYNPVRFSDPSGHRACDDFDENGQCLTENDLVKISQPIIEKPKGKFHPFGLDSDYYSLSIYHGAPGWLLGLVLGTAGLAEPTPAGEIGGLAIAALVNAGATITIDRYGRLFVSPGASIGVNSVETLPTVSLTSGNLMTGEYKGLPTMDGGTPTDIELLLSEFSTTHNASYAFFPNVGITESPAAPHNSIESGWGVPGHIGFVTLSWGFGPWQIIK